MCITQVLPFGLSGRWVLWGALGQRSACEVTSGAPLPPSERVGLAVRALLLMGKAQSLVDVINRKFPTNLTVLSSGCCMEPSGYMHHGGVPSTNYAARSTAACSLERLGVFPFPPTSPDRLQFQTSS